MNKEQVTQVHMPSASRIKMTMGKLLLSLSYYGIFIYYLWLK